MFHIHFTEDKYKPYSYHRVWYKLEQVRELLWEANYSAFKLLKVDINYPKNKW